ncbi:DUF2180 family protein [Microbacterium sp. LWH11-1.2]|uniref:DUF2180 family protein n=1 Tax=unclassified Microbacterium TaxID=2609290 RepID=UPI00313A2ABC
MHCFSHSRNGEGVPAVAICTQCGVGVCVAHAHVATISSRDNVMSLGNPSERRHQRIRCLECAEAA